MNPHQTHDPGQQDIDDTLVAVAYTDAYYRTHFPQAICGFTLVARKPTLGLL